MASFTHPRLDVALACAEDDIGALADINRSLREQVVSLLLEVAILREQAQTGGARGRGAEPGRGD